MSNSFYDSAYASQPNVALAHTVHGEPVGDTVRPNNTQSNVVQAVGSLYRPYVKPKRKIDGKVRCDTEGCRAWPTKTGHCAGHSRSLGLIPNWNQEGRKPNESE